MITCIAQIKENHTIQELAQEVWELFGEGGNTEAPIIEEFLGYVNTPITSDGYVRCAFNAKYITALGYIKEIDGSDAATVISVESEGQEMFDTLDGPLGMICGIPLRTPE